MMYLLEHVSDQVYKGYFVDLYVRCTNQIAITMYEGLGYSVYRRVREYYGSLGLGKSAKDAEDAFGENIRFSWSVFEGGHVTDQRSYPRNRHAKTYV